MSKEDVIKKLLCKGCTAILVAVVAQDKEQRILCLERNSDAKSGVGGDAPQGVALNRGALCITRV